MAHYLTMPKKSQVLALLELDWSYRQIEAETGVRRETVSRYAQARQGNAAKTFPGSDPPVSGHVPDLAPPRGQRTRTCLSSWNQISLWLRQCDNLRSTVVSAP